MKMPAPHQLLEDANHAAGQAAEHIDHASRDACDHLADKANQAVDAVKPAVDRWTREAESAAHRGVDAVRATSRELGERVSRASDSAAAYVKNEPIKAMLLAAAAGAALVTAIGWLNRSNRHD